MQHQRLVSIPEYWQLPEADRPTTFPEMIDVLLRMKKEISGHWQRLVTDSVTGEILQEVWAQNVITDNGALNALKNIFFSTGGTITVYNVMGIAPDAGSCKTSSSISAGSITSVPITGLAASIPSGTQIKIGYGIANETLATTSSLTSSGATTIAVTSVTIPSGGIPAGADVVPVPLVTDNPSSLSSAAYLSLASGDYAYTAGSGSGNRVCTVTKKFPGASTTAGTYTSARLSNANPVASGSVGATLYLPQATINGSTDQTFVFVIKL
jgi:hypothetical protein